MLRIQDAHTEFIELCNNVKPGMLEYDVNWMMVGW